MKQSALGSVFIFQKRGIGLDNYKGKEFMSRPAMGSQVVIILMEKYRCSTELMFWYVLENLILSDFT